MISSALLAVSCTKKTGREVALENTDFSNRSFVQIYNGTIGSARNYVYVDGNPVTGAALAYGSTFPSTPANFSVTPGYRAFLIRDTSSTILTQPALEFAENFPTSKNYTVFMYDTVTSPKQKTVANNIEYPTDTTSRLRFANFIFTTAGAPAVDVFSVKRNANIFSNILQTDVTAYIPFQAGGLTALNDTLMVRDAGTLNLLAQLNNFNPVPKRSYTIVFRGSYRVTAARFLSSFINY